MLSKDLECPGKGFPDAELKAEHFKLQSVDPWIREYISDMRNELKILSKLKHPGLIQEIMTQINSRSCEFLICDKIQQLEITDSVTRSERDFDFSNSLSYWQGSMDRHVRISSRFQDFHGPGPT